MNVRIEISETGAPTVAVTSPVVAAEAAVPIAAGQPQGSDTPDRAGAIDGGAPSAPLLAAVSAAGGLAPQPALATTNGGAANAGAAPL